MSDVKYPDDRRYTKEHEWITADGRVGITHFAQGELGDVVYVDLPKPGAKVEAGKPFGSVESVKAVSDLYSPVSGEVAEVNAALSSAPEKINADPHGDAWMIKVKLADPGQTGALMTAKEYEAYISDKAH